VRSLNKFERIQLVLHFGFNTENSFLLRDKEGGDQVEWWVRKFDKFSLRTYYPGSEVKDTPHYPTLTRKELVKLIRPLLKKGLHLIIAEQIDPKDCLFAGAAYKYSGKRNNNIIKIEIAWGPGTVRRVTHDNKIDIGISVSSKYKRFSQLGPINTCIDNFYRVALTNVMFEFSYYKIPVGILKENFICWEITSAGTGNSLLDDPNFIKRHIIEFPKCKG